MRELAFFVWIVRGEGSLGLVDAGLPDGADLEALRATGAHDDVVALADVLAGDGIAPHDIDWCAITQPITYHSGGLLADAFPRAHVFIAKAGVDELLGGPPGHPPAELYFTERSWAFVRELAMAGRLHLATEAVEIARGVTFEPTGGHHPGSAAVHIETADGVLAILETAFVEENLTTLTPVGLAEDVARCRAVIERYVATYDTVAAAHEPTNAARFP